ncbi:hypothetical protein EXE43_09530 [Halorubrum sp. SS5]|nr:hypothetical protein EXE43_09530 [Halorubrum sp. SS5]
MKVTVTIEEEYLPNHTVEYEDTDEGTTWAGYHSFEFYESGTLEGVIHLTDDQLPLDSVSDAEDVIEVAQTVIRLLNEAGL